MLVSTNNQVKLRTLLEIQKRVHIYSRERKWRVEAVPSAAKSGLVVMKIKISKVLLEYFIFKGENPR